MKRLLALILLLLPAATMAQNLGLLTNLHPRPQASYLYTNQPPSNFSNAPVRQILVDSNATVGTLKAVAYFQRQLRSILGDTLRVTHDRRQVINGILIIVGEKSEQAIQQEMDRWSLHDSLTRPEQYVLDVESPSMLVAGADSNGTFNGVSTLVQILQETKSTDWHIPALHINDWPDYPLRWVFSMHNMMVQSQVDGIKVIEDSMAAHKLNGLQQNDFKYSILDWFDSYYYGHVDSMRVHAEQNNISVIPGVASIGYSQGELIHDPDMAEGIPTVCRYVIEGDTGRLIGDPRVAVPNGNLENSNGTTFPGWGYYDTTVHVETSVVHSGQYAARVNNFTSSATNGRFIKMLTCSPHHGYRMSAWVKTQGFRGEFNLLAIGFHGTSSRALTYTQFGVPADEPTWQQANVIFNTLDYDSLYVYCGVWSGSAGTIWMDDFKIEDAGMVNMLRRTDEMPTVTGAAGTYTEGTDYKKLVDSIMEVSNGSYTWHESPTLRILAGSRIHNGDTVQVSFIRANPVLNYLNGDGSTMVCVSEDTLYSIIGDQVRRVDSLLHKPSSYFISHDEIRQMNWDKACTSTTRNPAELLSYNVKKCDSIVSAIHPGADKFDWSDMFDPFHNAYNNYYLVNGTLNGVWNIIPKSLTIMNWNSGFMDSSLAFFGKLGFNQMTSPYYDEHDTRNIREWRKAMERNPTGMRGMMYTTWAADYSYLTPFADYAWSAGPMIVHQPTALTHQITYGEYPLIAADVFPDPYDGQDAIDSVIYIESHYSQGRHLINHVRMTNTQGAHWEGATNATTDSGTSITYHIEAKNKQGIVRTTPEYLLFTMPGASTAAVTADRASAFSIYPNPASDHIELSLSHSNAEIEIASSLGAIMKTMRLTAQESTIDTKDLPAGTYTMRIKDGAEILSRSFVIVR